MDALETLINDWISGVKKTAGNEYLETDFNNMVKIIYNYKKAGYKLDIWILKIIDTLIEEIFHGLKPRFKNPDIFSIQYKDNPCGNYYLVERKDYVGPCRGPHIELRFELAPTWILYVNRCYNLIQNLYDQGLYLPDWVKISLTQEQCDILSYPLLPHKIGEHRGCWHASFHAHIDEDFLSGLLGDLGFLPPVAEEHFLKYPDYPPDDSILAHPDYRVFRMLLTGIIRSRSPLAKDILLKFLNDEESWVRNLAIELLRKT